MVWSFVRFLVYFSASRTSLLSTSCLSTTAALHSRKTVRNRSPVVGTVGDGASSDMHCVQFDRISNCVTKGSHDDKSADDAFGVDTGRSLLSHNEDSENVVSHRCVPADPRRRPSYTKLSCALSGYNKYSCYSSSRDTMLRSSSSSSVSSKLQSPDRSQVTSPAGDTVNRSPQSSLAPSDGCVPSVSAGTAGSSGIDAVTTLSVPPVNGRCVPPCNNATRYPPGNAIKVGVTCQVLCRLCRFDVTLVNVGMEFGVCCVSCWWCIYGHFLDGESRVVNPADNPSTGLVGFTSTYPVTACAGCSPMVTLSIDAILFLCCVPCCALRVLICILPM